MHSEHAEQCAVISWARLMESRWPELELLHAVQNWAGVKGPREGARRKAEGVCAGVPDLHLPVARSGYHSLYVEMKTVRLIPRKTMPPRRKKTKPTVEQLRWIDALRKAGNAVEVCHSAEEAQGVIEAYLEGRYPTPKVDPLNRKPAH